MDLAQWPHHCVVTKRAMQDIVQMGLTKEAVLEAIRVHLGEQRPTKVITQKTGLRAYVLLPCSVETHDLYVKVQLPPSNGKCDEVLVIISAHKPLYGH
jgi:hypothetical protein